MTVNPLTGWRIIAIDDSALIQRLVAEILAGFGAHDVFVTAIVDEAFARITTRRPDVVLCDWEMEPVDGLSFLRRVRKHTNASVADTPFIMLTAHSATESVRAAVREGANSYIIKPFAPATLLSHILKVKREPAKATWSVS